MYTSLQKWIFRLDPEKAHHWTVKNLAHLQTSSLLLSSLHRYFAVEDPRLHVHCFQQSFPNPVGLAAGFDKHANIYPALAALGYGFVEVGTLTPRPQPGNPIPRLFRLPEEEAIINRMGFNNDGVEQATRHFEHLPRPNTPIGINLGKNKDTSNEDAAEDYCTGLRALYRFGDYFVINISSPNTAGLRDLHQTHALRQLLTRIMAERTELMEGCGEKRPILLKLSPDIAEELLPSVIETSLELGIDGYIATNTTLDRSHITHPLRSEQGGLSGRPLAERSTKMIRAIAQQSEGRVPIIGVGGIFTGQDAYDKIRAGAHLVQVYTSMIYRGPTIARLINQELLTLIARDGLSSINEAIGADIR
ncbi:quinone-dependent dihydroorotate dehydrogenase [Mechercharimyces sp. CAU 1602]|nr:quinone-dependent dihydroorotate dehydrogenase [Mechercharimyces sp. CAU 1602]